METISDVRARTKLQKAIMLAYRERFNRFKKAGQNHDKTTTKPRQNPDKTPMKDEKFSFFLHI